uniref:Heparanase-like n=1 Tax=Crassostrea virginica TaxID=6565 RepID=A0A8B8EDC1_CRAVI|nr:heparanase-like [Crassostrea virginica]
MNGCIFVFIVFIVGKCLSNTVFVTFDPNSIISTTSEQFVGVTFDTGLIRVKWGKVDFRSPKVLALAKNLSPYSHTYVRFGGTAADFCTFTLSNETTGKEAKPCLGKRPGCDPVSLILRNKQKNLTEFYLTAKTWDEIHQFVQEAKFDIIFDLNVLKRTKDDKWNSTNARELMNYTQKKGYRMAGWELGNEPNSFHHLNSTLNVTAQSLGESFFQLSQILTQFPTIKGNILTGPSTTQLNKKPTVEYFTTFMETKAGGLVTSPNFHQYYVNGRIATVDDFTNSEILDSLQDELRTGNRIIRDTGGKKQLWLGETSSAYGGGANGLSDAYVAAFMWLDKLGMAAKNNVGVVLRQSFYGGKYALLDDKTLDPNPDYWLTVLYKRLVGNRVLNTTSTPPSRDVRFYAHCSAAGSPAGSVTLYGMNLLPEGINVTFPQLEGELEIYLLSAPNGNLKSRFVNLNGVTLEMTSDTSLPELIPIPGTSPVFLPPFSYVFIVSNRSVYSKACLV